MALGKRKTSATVATAAGWQPPSDWPTISDCALGNIKLLVNDGGMATYAFTCSTTNATSYMIDWGDGTVALYASGATAQHTYVVGAGQKCSLGYSTFKVTISAPNGYLKTFLVAAHNLATNYQYVGILSAVIRATNLTSLGGAFYVSGVYCAQLESCIVSDPMPLCTSAATMFDYCYSLQNVNVSGLTAVTTATSMFNACYSLETVDVSKMTAVVTATTMFQSCYSLQTVDVSKMTAVTTATSMFQSCLSLQTVDVSKMTAVTTATNMFNACSSLQTVDVSKMTAVTTATNMFNACSSLQTVDVSAMKAVTTATSMFKNCFALSVLNLANFGSVAASVQCDTMFQGCEQLTTITMPNAKVTTLGAQGATGKLNKLATITFNASSLFNNATAPQLDISYTTLTEAQILAIMSALPAATTQTARITGATGAAAFVTDYVVGGKYNGWTVNSAT